MSSPYKFAWEKIVPKADPENGSPCGRSSHGLSLLNKGKRLLLHGGEHVARTPLSPSQTTWAAEEKDGVWSWRHISAVSQQEESQLPPARVAHSQCVYNDSTVYIFGGRAGIGMEEKAMNDLWKLDCSGEPGTETWSLVTPDLKNGDEPPEARSFHQMLCVDTSIFIFGGCGESGRLADIHRFDILTNTWKTLPASPLLRGRGGANFMSFDSSKRLGVVAGFCGEESNDGHIFEPSTETWAADDMTQDLSGLRPRSVCVSASFPSVGASVIFGGEVDPSDLGHEGAGGFESDIVLLDEKNGKYISSEPAADGDEVVWPENRGWSDGASIDSGDGSGKLYMFGGLAGDDAEPKRLDDLWKLDISKA